MKGFYRPTRIMGARVKPGHDAESAARAKRTHRFRFVNDGRGARVLAAN
jgi:hypothetical protein